MRDCDLLVSSGPGCQTFIANLLQVVMCGLKTSYSDVVGKNGTGRWRLSTQCSCRNNLR